MRKGGHFVLDGFVCVISGKRRPTYTCVSREIDHDVESGKDRGSKKLVNLFEMGAISAARKRCEYGMVCGSSHSVDVLLFAGRGGIAAGTPRQSNDNDSNTRRNGKSDSRTLFRVLQETNHRPSRQGKV
ncbi:hypothetical protein AVEN_261805-1 [Araneus ventricosus]|uniref:Uncharacterized protein n=1 Tax=Araneus ventricosus TaxID=182803 RepID=A0A4Y2LZ00_ARAVE|nr:hypothetical protein AVEN_261805-1 [Araneus ventricosus]